MDWWHDIQQRDNFQPPFHFPTHGAIFNNGNLYASHVCWSIASYFIIHSGHFLLDPNKWVNLSPHNLSRMDEMSDQPLKHSLHLWYYPPHVRDVSADFETAACRYTERFDTFTLTKGSKRKWDKLENKRADEDTFPFGSILVTTHDASLAGHQVKKAKTIAAETPSLLITWEMHQIHDGGPPPPWFPKQQGVWKHTMLQATRYNLKEGQSPCQFVLPPFTSSRAPLNWIRARIITTFSFCRISFQCAPEAN